MKRCKCGKFMRLVLLRGDSKATHREWECKCGRSISSFEWYPFAPVAVGAWFDLRGFHTA